MRGKEKLDQMALDIEFLLISVIQGVAVATLATTAFESIEKLQIIYWPYVITGFLFILIFWSGAIVHAVSFIDWPIDLMHGFLYLLASFVEVVALSHVTDPTLWFISLLIFQLIAALLYWYDLQMIKKRERLYKKTAAKKALYESMYAHQLHELKKFIPASLLFNAVAVFLLIRFPDIFLRQDYQLVLILLQMVFSFVFLRNVLKNFQKRATLIRKAL